jgi:hypothetical protein
MATYWQRQENTAMLAALLEPITRKKWVDSSFHDVQVGDFLHVTYITHSQRHVGDWENRCGVVLSFNREDDHIYGITLLLVNNYEQIEIPYEREDSESMGGYTNDHSTYLQILKRIE